MKKIMIVLVAFAVIFCFAACNKNKAKGEIYTPPQTEIVTFENGETVIYEVVTEANGEAATDEEGETKYIPYIPPVTEEGGYLVTDAAGSTVPSLPGSTTAADSAKPTDKAVDSDQGSFEGLTTNTEETKQNENGTTVQGESKPSSETTTQQGDSVLVPEKTTVKAPEKTTAKVPDIEAPTQAIDGELTPAKAQKLISIVKGVENPFEDCLVEGDFYGAETAIDEYIKNIENAVNEIKADKALYQFVGNEQLDKWLGSMVEAKDYYAIFMTMVRQEDKTGERNPLFFKAYTDFQDYYKASLESYFFIIESAQEKI